MARKIRSEKQKEMRYRKIASIISDSDNPEPPYKGCYQCPYWDTCEYENVGDCPDYLPPETSSSSSNKFKKNKFSIKKIKKSIKSKLNHLVFVLKYNLRMKTGEGSKCKQIFKNCAKCDLDCIFASLEDDRT